MKHLVPASLTALVLVAFLVASCDYQAQDADTSSTVQNPFNRIAASHSVGLDAVYEELSTKISEAEKSGDAINRAQLVLIAQRSSVAFMEEQGMSNEDANLYVSVGMQSAGFMLLPEGTDKVPPSKKVSYENMKDPQRVEALLDRVYALPEELSPEQYSQELENIEAEVYRTLEGRDADLVLMGAAIGRDSQAYWNRRMQDWVELLQPTISLGKVNDHCWDGVIQTDIEAAIAVGLVGWWAAIPSLGTAIVAGALSGSAASILGNIYLEDCAGEHAWEPTYFDDPPAADPFYDTWVDWGWVAMMEASGFECFHVYVDTYFVGVGCSAL